MLMQAICARKNSMKGLMIPEGLRSQTGSDGRAGVRRKDGYAAAPAPSAGTGHLATKADHPGELSGHEVQHLQRTLAIMVKENKTLKDEVHKLRDKLDQIKRIA